MCICDGMEINQASSSLQNSVLNTHTHIRQKIGEDAFSRIKSLTVLSLIIEPRGNIMMVIPWLEHLTPMGISVLA